MPDKGESQDGDGSEGYSDERHGGLIVEDELDHQDDQRAEAGKKPGTADQPRPESFEDQADEKVRGSEDGQEDRRPESQERSDVRQHGEGRTEHHQEHERSDGQTRPASCERRR